jgi:DNA-binding NarL/FixJ family response regulator
VDGTAGRVRIALVNDYELVLRGLAHMLRPFADRVEIVELDARERVTGFVDVALYDTFAQPEPDDEDVSRLVGNPHNRHVAVFTWKMDQHLIDAALRRGATGYFAKSMAAADLVAGLETVAAGGTFVRDAGSPRRPASTGRAVTSASRTASPRSSPSSPSARATRRSPCSPT